MFNLGVLSGVIDKELTIVDTNSTDYKIASMVLSSTRNYPDIDGNFLKDYYEITFYNQTAEYYIDKFKVNEKVIIRGKLCQDNYSKDDKTYYHLKFIGETISKV